jgi:hypothetical protein
MTEKTNIQALGSTAELGWRPMSEAKADGTVCDIRFRDNLGSYELSGCFLHDDGEWYLIEPPTLINKKPVSWRPNAEITGGASRRPG